MYIHFFVKSLRAFCRADLDFRSDLLIVIQQESVTLISQLQAFDEMFWLSRRMCTCQNKNWGSWGSLGGSQGALKTEVVLWGRPGMVLGGPWGGFRGMGPSLGES